MTYEMMDQSVQTSLDCIQVTEVDPRGDPCWQAFVAAHPDALIYHHPAWLRVLAKEYGRKPVGLVCKDAEGRIRGVLPLTDTRGIPFKIGGKITGRRLSSLPRTPVAGPLSLDTQATAALVHTAVERARAKPGTQLEVKAWSNGIDTLVPDMAPMPWRLTYVLELPKPPENIRFGNSRNHGRISWAVKKAAKSGIQVRQAETETELREWYRLYLDTMRWHAVPPRPYRFFKACWEQLRPDGLMRLLLAELHEGGSRKLVAGSIFLMFGRTVFYAFSARDLEYLRLRPNDAIQWQAIHDAQREGFCVYDFGEVVEDNEGLAEFKSKWGAEAKRLYRYYYPAPRDLGTDPLNETSLTRRLTMTLWRRAPLTMTALLGDWIYSFL